MITDFLRSASAAQLLPRAILESQPDAMQHDHAERGRLFKYPAGLDWKLLAAFTVLPNAASLEEATVSVLCGSDGQ